MKVSVKIVNKKFNNLTTNKMKKQLKKVIAKCEKFPFWAKEKINQFNEFFDTKSDWLNDGYKRYEATRLKEESQINSPKVCQSFDPRQNKYLKKM